MGFEFGYNTDVNLGSDHYHVQTEGKFGKNPRIDTLVYLSGSVLHKLTRAQSGLSMAPAQREASQKLIKKQHLRVVSLIRKGNFERLAYEVAHPEEAVTEAAPAPPPPATAAPPPAAPLPMPEFDIPAHTGDATVMLRRPVLAPRPAAPAPPPVSRPIPVAPPVEEAGSDFFLDGPASPPPSYETVEVGSDVVSEAVAPESDATPDASPEDSFFDGEPPSDAAPPVASDDEAVFDVPLSDVVVEDDIEGAGGDEGDEDTAGIAEAVTGEGFFDPAADLEAPLSMADEAPAPAAPSLAAPSPPPPADLPRAPFADADADATIMIGARGAAPGPAGTSGQQELIDLKLDAIDAIEPAAPSGPAPSPTPRATPAAAPAPPAPPPVVAKPAAAPTPRPSPPTSAPPAARPAAAPRPASRVAPAPAAASGGKGKGIAIVAAIVVLLGIGLIVAVAGAWFLKGGGEEETPTPEPTEVVATPTTPAPTEAATPTPSGPDPDEIVRDAMAQAGSGDAAAAIAALTRAAGKAEPKVRAEIDLGRGRLERLMGRRKEAAVTLRKAAASGAPSAVFLAGLAALEAGSVDDVAWALQTLQSAPPGEAASLHAILDARQRFAAGSVDEAAALLRQAIHDAPEDPRGYHAMGDILLALGVKNSLPTFLVNARENFDKAKDRDPENVEIDVSLAHLAIASRDLDGARSTLDRALQSFAASYDAQLLSGEIRLRQQNAAGARAPLAAAAKLSPTRAEAHLLAGTAAAKTGDHVGAVEEFLASMNTMEKPDYAPYPEVHASRDALKAMISDSIKKALQTSPDNKSALKLLDITVNLG